MSTATYFAYWAKADDGRNGTEAVYHLLPYHLLDVAACMENLLRRVPGAVTHLAQLLGMEPDTALPTLTWLAGLHDVGKFSEAFQGLRDDIHGQLAGDSLSYGYHIRHDALGRELITHRLLCARPMTDWLNLEKLFGSGRELREAIKPLIEAVASHHGQPAEHPHHRDAKRHFADRDYDAFQTFCADFHNLLGVAPEWTLEGAELKETFKLGSWALAGWMVLADWLGSNETFFPFAMKKQPLDEYWPRAQKMAAAAVDKSGVLAPSSAKYEGLHTLFPDFDAPSPLQDYAQTVAIDGGPQLFILEDATGAGKTEAALILASRMMNRDLANGVYIGLPTTATANGMYERMGKAYKRFFAHASPASLMLAHSSRDISDDYQASIQMAPENVNVDETYDESSTDATASATCATWLSDSRKKALLAPFGVGTIDQALLAGLPAKHQSLRLAGLCRKILIVDEIHAYDAYMNGLLHNLLEFHAAQGGSAILLSATLPQQLRQELSDSFYRGLDQPLPELNTSAFPLATHCGQELKETDITDHMVTARDGGRAIRPQKSHDVAVSIEPDRDQCIAHLVAAAQRGECACWIRNTVGEAIDTYELLRQHISDENITLFHARFSLQDRQDIESRVLSSFGKDSESVDRAGRIVVATQVIEQSLDLDFDCMVTDLAPVDLVIQRAGRLHRHDRGRDKEPRLIVHGPHATDDADKDWYADCFDGAQWVYRDHGKLWLSARALEKFERIRVPELARDLVEYVYSGTEDLQIPTSLDDSRMESLAEEFEHENMADFNALEFSRGYGDASSGRWFEDTRTPTRLGDPTITLRLGRVTDDGNIQPWAGAKRYEWRLSELSVRATKVCGLGDLPSISSDQLERVRESMFDKGKWSELIPLTAHDSIADLWTCPIIDANEDERILTYSRQLGLRIISEDS